MRRVLSALLLLIASAVAADPVVTSVSPNSGSVAGGYTVTIKGTGFNNTCIICSPPFAEPSVFFGTTQSRSVRVIDVNTIEAVAPPHLPTHVSITVRQHDGSQTNGFLADAFLYTGDPELAFDPVLFPIFLPPVDGAFGSRFETSARAGNRASSNGPLLYGLDTSCYTFSPTIHPFDPIGVSTSYELLTGCSHSTGRIFWVAKNTGPLAAGLRVRDTSRNSSSHGVEVPVVKREDFTNDRLALLGVPVDPRFRKTLRVYSLARGQQVIVNVGIDNIGIGQIFLPPSTSLFEPAYAEFTDFPEDRPAGSTMTVSLTMGKLPDGSIPPGTPLIWGMLSVTNNETQEITIISPQQ